MEKLKISESDKRLLIILLAIILLAVSYFFVFSGGMKKAQEIEEENTKNQQRVMQLESMVARQSQVKKEIKEYKKSKEDIIAKYPADVTEEKAIWLIQEMERKADFEVDQISFITDNAVLGSDSAQPEGSDSSEVSDESSSEGSESSAEGEASGSTAVGTGGYMAVTVNYEATYQGLKDMVAYVNKSDDRMTIPVMTATYDSETGKVKGTLTVNMYYIKDTGKEYEPPRIDGISQGVSNVFGLGAAGKKK